MSTFKIEKGVPLGSRFFGDCPYPFHEMEVGDSFFVAIGAKTLPPSDDEFERVYAAKDSLKKHADRFRSENPGFHFVVRAIKWTGVRCWRVDPKKKPGHEKGK